jgi:hypothetical protein
VRVYNKEKNPVDDFWRISKMINLVHLFLSLFQLIKGYLNIVYVNNFIFFFAEYKKNFVFLTVKRDVFA